MRSKKLFNALSRWAWVWSDALLPFLLSRILILSVAFIALQTFRPPEYRDAWQVNADGAPLPFAAGANLQLNRTHALQNALSRWDGGWYLAILLEGYSYDPEKQNPSGFFPLYPMMVKGVALVLGQGMSPVGLITVGVVISHLCSALAVILLVGLVRMEGDAELARRAGLYLCIFPSTLYLSGLFTEGLFLAVTLGAFYCARCNRWWWAGLLAAAASATRSPGVFIGLGLAVEYMRQRQWQWRAIRWNVLALGLVPVGLGLFCAWLWWRFDDPLLFNRGQAQHDRHFAAPWVPFVRVVETGNIILGAENSWVDFGVGLAVVLVMIVSWFRLSLPYAVLLNVMLLLPLCTNQISGMLRYAMGTFPVFMVLAGWGRNPWFHRGWVVFSTALAALFTAMMATWYYVT